MHPREFALTAPTSLSPNPNPNPDCNRKLIMTHPTLRAHLLAIGIAVAATFSAALVPATSFAYDESSPSAVNVDPEPGALTTRISPPSM